MCIVPARLCWKEMVGVRMPSCCPTCWWNKWEVMKALLVAFGDDEDFLVKHHDISSTTTSKLRKMLMKSPN